MAFKGFKSEWLNGQIMAHSLLIKKFVEFNLEKVHTPFPMELGMGERAGNTRWNARQYGLAAI